VILSKSGLLLILWFLFNKKEARFKEFLTDFGIPRKTLARRLIELGEHRLVKLRVHQDTKGKGYHVYVLTEKGSRLVRNIGLRTVERFVSAEKELDNAERTVLGLPRLSSNSTPKDTR